MGTKPVARFTVEILGQPRSLFSVVENSKGNLTLGIGLGEGHHRSRGENPLHNPTSAPKPISKHYYSIHPSENSVERVNVINHHKHFEGGIIKTSHYTQAIKSGEAFARIFCRRCHDQRHSRHIAKPNKGKIVSIGRHDPTRFTLVYMVVASAAGVPFELSFPQPDLSLTFRDFKKVRLTILSTYVNHPAGGYDLTGHLSTERPDKGDQAIPIVLHFFDEVARMMEEVYDLASVPEQNRVALRKYRYFTNDTSPPATIFRRRIILGERLLAGYLEPWPLA